MNFTDASSTREAPGANNSPEFEEKFQRAQSFVGCKVLVKGAPEGHRDPGHVGICTGVVRIYGKDSVDFILADGKHFGFHLDFVSDETCVGLTNSLCNFVRTVTRVQDGG